MIVVDDNGKDIFINKTRASCQSPLLSEEDEEIENPEPLKPRTAAQAEAFERCRQIRKARLEAKRRKDEEDCIMKCGMTRTQTEEELERFRSAERDPTNDAEHTGILKILRGYCERALNL